MDLDSPTRVTQELELANGESNKSHSGSKPPRRITLDSWFRIFCRTNIVSVCKYITLHLTLTSKCATRRRKTNQRNQMSKPRKNIAEAADGGLRTTALLSSLRCAVCEGKCEHPKILMYKTRAMGPSCLSSMRQNRGPYCSMECLRVAHPDVVKNSKDNA